MPRTGDFAAQMKAKSILSFYSSCGFIANFSPALPPAVQAFIRCMGFHDQTQGHLDHASLVNKSCTCKYTDSHS